MRVFRYAMALLVAGFLFLLAAPVASADPIVCQGKVVDTTSDQVLDISKVEESIKGVEAFGADVYVRAFQQTPGGSVEAFWEQGLNMCANWRTPDFNAKPNVILVLLGMDRQSAVYFNKARYPSLDSRADAIRANDMNANFKAQEFTTGVTSALDSIAREIDPNKPVAPATDYSGVWKFLLWTVIGIVGLVAVGVLSWLGIRSYGSHRKEKQARLKAQDQAQKARTRADNAVANAKTSETLEQEFLVAVGNLPSQLVSTHRATLDRITGWCGGCHTSYMEMVGDPNSDPAKRLTTETYIELRDEYSRIAGALNDVDREFDALLRAIEDDKLKLTKSARATKLAAINHEIDQLSAVLNECVRMFLTTPYTGEIEKLRRDSQSAAEKLNDDANAWWSYEQIVNLEKRVAKVGNDVSELSAARTRILNVRTEIVDEASKRRSVLKGLQHVDPAKALRELSRIEGQASGLYARLKPGVSHTDQLKEIDRYLGKIQLAGDSAVSDNKKIIAKKKEEAEAERVKNRKKPSSSGTSSRYGSSRDSSADAFGGGLLGGVIGGSIGSNSSPSPSYSPPPSYDYGGSGGSWGGGGFDGGGSGGSW